MRFCLRRIQQQRLPQRHNRIAHLALRLEHTAKHVVETRDTAIGRNRLVEPVDRGARNPVIEGDIPQERERLDMIGFFLEDLFACRPRLLDPAGFPKQPRLREELVSRPCAVRLRGGIRSRATFPELDVAALKAPRKPRLVHQRRTLQAFAKMPAQILQARAVAGQPGADCDIFADIPGHEFAEFHGIEEARSHASRMAVSRQ